MKIVMVILTAIALLLTACSSGKSQDEASTKSAVIASGKSQTAHGAATPQGEASNPAAETQTMPTPSAIPMPKAEDLQGRWSIHPDGLRHSSAFKKMSESSQSLALAQLEQMTMDIVITKDTITVHGQNGEDKFSDATGYTIQKQAGASFVIKTDKKGRGHTQTLTLNGDFLEVSEGGPKMIFKRIKSRP